MNWRKYFSNLAEFHPVYWCRSLWRDTKAPGDRPKQTPIIQNKPSYQVEFWTWGELVAQFAILDSRRVAIRRSIR